MKETFTMTKPLRHLAVIMDGNGRWAKKRGLPRTIGHREGCKRIVEIFDLCKKYGIQVFTLYAFSTENWNRPKEEIRCLFEYLDEFFQKNIEKFVKEGVRVSHMGDPAPLPEKTQKILADAIEKTRDNDRYVFNICLNYGARQELTRACRKIAEEVRQGTIDPSQIDETCVNRHLDSAELPAVDLMIRTSGEVRLSNFLLWQLAYSEMIFTPTYWPDFKEKEFVSCLKEYCSRDRRFGRIKE